MIVLGQNPLENSLGPPWIEFRGQRSRVRHGSRNTQAGCGISRNEGQAKCGHSEPCASHAFTDATQRVAMPPGIVCTKMQRRRVHTPQHSQTKPHSRCECALCFGRLAPTRTSRARGQENLITARLANGSARSLHAHGQPRHGDTHTHTHIWQEEHALPRGGQ